jgi:hypothetical protein
MIVADARGSGRINLCCAGPSRAVLPGTFASVITLTGVMWVLQTGRLVFP